MIGELILSLGAATLLLGAISACVALAYWALQAWPLYQRFRGPRVVTCPETGRAAGVEVAARRVAATALRLHPEIRLESCSRWPERRDCGQDCLRQIEAAPEDCLVRNVLARFYVERACAFCGKPFGAIHWHDHKPALRRSDGTTVEWARLRPEQVPEALETAKPVCWNCHVAETFRREHPELVTDRPWSYDERHPPLH